MDRFLRCGAIRAVLGVSLVLLASACGGASEAGPAEDPESAADHSGSQDGDSGESGGSPPTGSLTLGCIGVQWAQDGHETVTASSPQEAARKFDTGLDRELNEVVEVWSNQPTRVVLDWDSRTLTINDFPENMPDSRDDYELTWEESDSGYEFEVTGSETRSAEGWRLSTISNTSEYGPLGVLAALHPASVAWSGVTSTGPDMEWPPVEVGLQPFDDTSGDGVLIAGWSDRENRTGQLTVCLEQ